MTMNQLTQTTVPNTAAATSVSPLEQSGSSKTKFLQSQPELAKSNVRTEVCNPDNYLSQRISEQQGYLNELYHFNDQWQPERPQRLMELLMVIAGYIPETATNWQDVADFGDKPQIPYAIMHCWLAAMELAPQLCGETGTAAVAYVRDDLKKNMACQCALAAMDCA